MASFSSSSSNNINSNNPNTPTLNSIPNISNYSLPNTTFVQAHPSTFRAVVQRLTGATQDSPPSHKLPVTRLSGKSNSGEMGPRRPAFKLHERRPTARKLENIKLNNINHGGGSTAAAFIAAHAHMVVVSPVSPLECWAAARGSPKTPMEKEEKAISEKGFYLHPINPLSAPRKPNPPELLPLFPLHSPSTANNYSSSS